MNDFDQLEDLLAKTSNSFDMDVSFSGYVNEALFEQATITEQSCTENQETELSPKPSNNIAARTMNGECSLPAYDDGTRKRVLEENDIEESSSNLASKKAKNEEKSLENGVESDEGNDLPPAIGNYNENNFEFPHKNDTSNNSMYEFDILDEFEGAPDDKSEGDDQSDSDIPEDEIEAMLEEGLKNNVQRKHDELAHEEKQKIVLKSRGHDHFDILPEGWIVVTHNSGMPVYLHKHSRVCTMAKPYFLGSGSARKHEIPISAIPCFQYRRELIKEKESMENKVDFDTTAITADEPLLDLDLEIQEQSTNAVQSNSTKVQKLPPAKVESVQESQKEHSLEPMAVREYCGKLFEFQTLTVRRFKTWAGRRKHQKLMKQAQRPSLPESTKLITCPLPPTPDKVQAGGAVGNGIKREFIMNPSGKSYVCILHEYVQHAMRMQPRYVFKELENASTPYGATVVINDMEYGSGLGSSKKQAKSEAARVSLEILIPQLKQNEKNSKGGQELHQQQQQDVAFFDEVRVEDPRVSDLCAKAGQPSPYQILLECLKRNYGMGDTQIKFEMQNLKHQKNEFKMMVGKHSASVVCKNKRDGKQRASQAILQALHPHITSWGSLLRLYGKGSCKTLKEKKEEEQRITELQSKACANRPNISILNKLKEEMEKLRDKRESIRPIGKFIPEEMDLPSSSSSNLKNVEL